MWMLKQLLKEMSDSTRLIGTGVLVVKATYGTKRNALVAVRDIIHAVLVDTSEIGMHLRENWFSGIEDTLKQAVRLLGTQELATLAKDRKWAHDLMALLEAVNKQKLGDETLKEILLIVAPTASDEEDCDTEENEGSEDDDEDDDGDENEEDEDEDEIGFDEEFSTEELSEEDETSEKEETSDENPEDYQNFQSHTLKRRNTACDSLSRCVPHGEFLHVWKSGSTFGLVAPFKTPKF